MKKNNILIIFFNNLVKQNDSMMDHSLVFSLFIVMMIQGEILMILALNFGKKLKLMIVK